MSILSLDWKWKRTFPDLNKFRLRFAPLPGIPSRHRRGAVASSLATRDTSQTASSWPANYATTPTVRGCFLVIPPRLASVIFSAPWLLACFRPHQDRKIVTSTGSIRRRSRILANFNQCGRQPAGMATSAASQLTRPRCRQRWRGRRPQTLAFSYFSGWH